jgi:hypothetical protein
VSVPPAPTENVDTVPNPSFATYTYDEFGDAATP